MAKSPTPATEKIAGVNDIRSVREKVRQLRLLRLAVTAAVLTAPLSLWLFLGSPIPSVDPFFAVIVVFFALMIGLLFLQMRVTGSSPHTLWSPEQIDTTFDDVVGIGPVKAEVVKTIQLFLAKDTFGSSMGGTPRRGVLFEGPPGTGKTLMAQAMAREAGVPFLFASATSFVSMWQGGTSKKIRSYFKTLRKIAREEGGAIGFIEEIDAIALARGGMNSRSTSNRMEVSGCGGLTGLPSMSMNHSETIVNHSMGGSDTGQAVNELLVQMQSFDEPYGFAKAFNKALTWLNRLLPESKHINLIRVKPANILIIAATNRADNLDPALLRPGRFDYRLAFDLPGKAGRREIIDYYLAKKAHDEDMATDVRRDQLAAITVDYSPVMISNLLNEALAFATVRGASKMSWDDVSQARLAITVGIGQPVEYTAFEEKLIASHEAGHATVAWLMAPQRRLEVLTIIKRKSALGLLAHGDAEDVYTRQRSEMIALIQIAMGGQVAEEILFGDVSTGPAGDLSYATGVAAQMVGAAGMYNSLISLEAAGGGMMDSGLVSRVISSSEGRKAVDEILNEAKASVKELLSENIHLVEALRDALLERKELIASEITDVLENAGPRPAVTPLVLANAFAA